MAVRDNNRYLLTVALQEDTKASQDFSKGLQKSINEDAKVSTASQSTRDEIHDLYFDVLDTAEILFKRKITVAIWAAVVDLKLATDGTGDYWDASDDSLVIDVSEL